MRSWVLCPAPCKSGMVAHTVISVIWGCRRGDQKHMVILGYRVWNKPVLFQKQTLPQKTKTTKKEQNKWFHTHKLSRSLYLEESGPMGAKWSRRKPAHGMGQQMWHMEQWDTTRSAEAVLRPFSLPPYLWVFWFFFTVEHTSCPATLASGVKSYYVLQALSALYLLVSSGDPVCPRMWQKCAGGSCWIHSEPCRYVRPIFSMTTRAQ